MADSRKQKFDRRQFAALFRASLLLDWRGSTNPLDAARSRKSRFPPFLSILVLNVIYSIIIALIMARAPDPFIGLVVGGLIAMILVGFQVLLEYGNIIISPDDYGVISPHPVNSRTFYLAKLAHVLFYITILSVSVACLPAIVRVAVSHDLAAIVFVPALFWVLGVFAGFLMMTTYTAVLQYADRRQVERILGYAQLALGFLFYGLYMMIAGVQKLLPLLNRESASWLVYLPPYWFASWISLAREGWNAASFQFGMLGLAAFVMIVMIGLSRLSLSYAESLSRLGPVKSRRHRGRPAGSVVNRWWGRFTSREEKALFSLFRAQFRHDTRFRMSVLSIVPIMIFALVYGAIRGMSFVDPFTAGGNEGDVRANFMPVFMVAWIPLTFHMLILYSSSFRASWIFHIACRDRVRLIMATRRVITLVLVIPFCLMVWGLFSYAIGNPVHAFLHIIVLYLLIMVLYTLMQIFQSDVPFSKEIARGQAGFLLGMIYLGSSLIIGVPVMLLAEYGYGGYMTYIIVVAAIVAVNALLGIIRNRVVRQRVRLWQYTA